MVRGENMVILRQCVGLQTACRILQWDTQISKIYGSRMECAIAIGVEAGDNTVGKLQRIFQRIARWNHRHGKYTLGTWNHVADLYLGHTFVMLKDLHLICLCLQMQHHGNPSTSSSNSSMAEEQGGTTDARRTKEFHGCCNNTQGRKQQQSHPLRKCVDGS